MSGSFFQSNGEFTSFFSTITPFYKKTWIVTLFTPSGKRGPCLFLLRFFQNRSFSGLSHFHNSGNVVTKLNVANCTDSKGFFKFNCGYQKRIKDSLISFKSKKTLKWIYKNGSKSVLSIEYCFIIASSTIASDDSVTLTKGSTLTASASTHTPFRFRPKYMKCGYFDGPTKFHSIICKH